MNLNIGDEFYGSFNIFLKRDIVTKGIVIGKAFFGEEGDTLYSIYFPTLDLDCLHHGFVGFHKTFTDKVRNGTPSKYKKCYNILEYDIQVLEKINRQLELF